LAQPTDDARLLRSSSQSATVALNPGIVQIETPYVLPRGVYLVDATVKVSPAGKNTAVALHYDDNTETRFEEVAPGEYHVRKYASIGFDLDSSRLDVNVLADRKVEINVENLTVEQLVPVS
jgi:hypothetical protein